jgi:hypothetical protein
VPEAYCLEITKTGRMSWNNVQDRNGVVEIRGRPKDVSTEGVTLNAGYQ